MDSFWISDEFWDEILVSNDKHSLFASTYHEGNKFIFGPLTGAETELSLSTICNACGTQYFFICPVCGRRTRFLYYTGQRSFKCRECAGINYKSQQATHDDMEYYRKGVAFLRDKFGVYDPPDGFSFPNFIPNKPKFMHWTTYDKHMRRLKRYQEKYAEQLAADMLKLFSSFGISEDDL